MIRSILAPIGLMLLMLGAARAENIQCPAHDGAGALTSVAVFDGPPEEQADLVPDINRHSPTRTRMEWRFEPESKMRPYLQCRYSAGASPLVIQLDERARQCVFLRAGKTVSANCS